ncbi:MAG: SAM-dependent methyltransferase [Chitinophagaceae bacterium]
MEPLIRNIADTALWVAVYRADETERPDAVFKDPFARKLAGERGAQIVAAMQEGRKNSWSLVARTYLFDELVLQYIQQGVDMVINLAAGLDTRAYRLSLPESLKWVDVDLPEMTRYMDSMMVSENPKCEYRRIALDLSNRTERLILFNELAAQGKNILVMAEGLVGYLNETDNGALAYDLARNKNFKFFALDLMSPGILPLIKNEMGNLLEAANSPLIFAPKEGEDFYLLFKWKPIASKSKLKTAAALKRLSSEMMKYAAAPEPKGPKGLFPWSGVCIFENRNR